MSMCKSEPTNNFLVGCIEEHLADRRVARDSSVPVRLAVAGPVSDVTLADLGPGPSRQRQKADHPVPLRLLGE
eukprot:343282-Pyramimonas_sp.AAC.1